MIGKSWLKDYQKYLVDIITFDDSLVHAANDKIIVLGALFKFPNGYHVKLDICGCEELKGPYDRYLLGVEVKVEILNKDGKRFTSESYENARNEKFPEKRRMLTSSKKEVESFFKKVFEI